MSQSNNLVSGPWGLQPCRNLISTTFNDQTNEYLIASGYASNIFNGDPVNQHVAAGADGSITIGIAAGALSYLGVFQGVKYYDALGNYVFSKFWPTGTVTWNPGGVGTVFATALVQDDPYNTWNVQGDGTLDPISGFYGIAQADNFYNASMVAAAGSTLSGLSGWTLGVSTIANTATLHLKILRIINVPTNFYATAANTIANPSFNNAEVIINNHMYKGGTGTVGPA